jgi:glycosyltransferase involved in cell wall biosynthesis
MRILIDLQGAQTESRFRGIGRYSLSIAQAVARNAGQHEVWLVLNGAFPDSLNELRAAFAGLVPRERIQVFDVPTPVAEHETPNRWRARAAEHIREHFLAELQPDVVLVTSLFEGYVDDAVTHVAPSNGGAKTAVILYDLIPYLRPDIYLPTTLLRQYYDRKIESLRNADLLLSISAYSREEAVDTLGLDPERVVNISTAVDARFQHMQFPDELTGALRERIGIRRDILMYAPGGFDSRKNFDGLITAYGQLPERYRAAYQLVIVSKINHGDQTNLMKIAAQAGLREDELVLTGYVSDDELVMLYNMAALFVFPSKHEGFGLPVLEAMACGAPVIGSNTTSIPEVIGSADALFDPGSSAAIAAKLEEVMADDAVRTRLREHGLAQARTFSWDRSGVAALAAIEQLVADAPLASSLSWERQQALSVQRYRDMLERVAAEYRSAPHADDEGLKLLAEVMARNLQRTERIGRSRPLPEKLSWRLEGPFDSSYSLALLNRETALALNALGHDVALHSTEGPGDFAAAPAFLAANPEIARLHARVAALVAEAADVCSRNLYPPRVEDMRSRFNMLHHYAWEESAFPYEWVTSFNEHLQAMTCLSTHVQKVMVDQGVRIPMATSGCGVDHWERVEADRSRRCPGRSFRFLHVSSCFPRKGADVLLRAYGDTFTQADDVSLVIKTFANPHNEIHTWLAEARRDNPVYPDVVILEEDMSDGELKGLLEQCHALVAPSRAEGFGMPLAEAMLSGLPVITTGWSGQLDFCTPDTSWLVDFTFAPAQTHFGLFGSVWAEPDRAHLATTMREVYALPVAERRGKADRGRELLMERFKWQDVAGRLVDAARVFSAPSDLPEQKIGWITTWNTKCGIATYSAHLIHSLPAEVTVFAGHADERTVADGAEVVRCWEPGENDTLEELSAAIDAAGVTTLVLQFNYGFFKLEHLAQFVLAQREAGRVVIAMLHATIDPAHVPHKRLEIVVPALRACQRVLVHSVGDLNRLKGYGLVDNVALFPHGVLDWPEPALRKPSETFRIASYGFFLPHKGLPQLVEAVALLQQAGRDVRLSMVNAEYPIADSAKLVEKVRKLARELGVSERVEFCTDFLDDHESLARLDNADLIIFPYQNTGESASGAVRYGLASGRHVAVTPLAIFDDVSRVTYRLPGQTPREIARGVEELIDDIAVGASRIELVRAEAERWRTSHRYSRLGERLLNMLAALQTAHLNHHLVAGSLPSVPGGALYA